MEKRILETVAQMELKNVLNQFLTPNTSVSVETVNGVTIESRLVNVTPKLAESLITRNTMNRSINNYNVNKLSTAMSNGEWNYDGQPLSFDNMGRLLNGQHRLQAVIKCGKTITFKIETGFKPEIFTTFDIGKVRSGANVLEIAKFSNPRELANASNFVAQYLRGSIGKNVILTNDPARSNGNGTLTHEQLLCFVNENPELETSVQYVMGIKKKTPKENRSLLSPYLLAGFHFLLSRKNEIEANLFIHKLMTGANILTMDSPIYVLRAKLSNAKGDNKMDKLAHNEIVKLIVLAWNMYNRGDKTNMKKFQIPALLPLIE